MAKNGHFAVDETKEYQKRWTLINSRTQLRPHAFYYGLQNGLKWTENSCMENYKTQTKKLGKKLRIDIWWHLNCQTKTENFD